MSHRMKLDGRCAIVTGAAKRVGRAIALELARDGCDVAIHYHRSDADARTLADEINAMNRRTQLLCGDLAKADTWSRTINEAGNTFGRLDFLINNASVFEPMSLDRFDPEDWTRTMQINVTAVVGLSHYAAPHLRRTGGAIVNLADISGDRPWSAHLAYCASKAALVNVTRSLAKALAPNVRVNAVSPGIAVFPDNYDDHTRAKLVAAVPAERPGNPEDIAKTVRFLCAEAHYITGQVINVDGGRSIA